MAYAGALFADACLRGLNGDPDVIECTYVASNITEVPFFSSKVKLGKNGKSNQHPACPLLLAGWCAAACWRRVCRRRAWAEPAGVMVCSAAWHLPRPPEPPCCALTLPVLLLPRLCPVPSPCPPSLHSAREQAWSRFTGWAS
jgi:hypothetical protein